MNLDKRNSYTSKSILSILQTTNDLPESNIPTIEYIIPSSILIIFSIISIWGIFFYLILGFCFYFKSGILIEDLNLIQENNIQLFNQEISKEYSQLSFHCFFSVCIYLIIFFICLIILQYRKKLLTKI
jgi:hypothetical protein